MIGLKRGTVALYPHSEEWDREAHQTANRLWRILGSDAVDIQHVGSTAIPTIMAKPIIDMAVAARSFEDVLRHEPELRANGFYYRSSSIPGQRLFASGSYYDGTGEEQTHFIHVVLTDSMEWRNYINFRDYLRANPAVAKDYEALKRRLAAECPVDEGREHYLAGKQDFITYTLRKALVYSFMRKQVKIRIDRPIGYVHQKENYNLTYPVNYGYIPGVIGGDGEELDVYLLGVDEPLEEAEVTVIGIVHRKNDVEDKLIAAPHGVFFSRAAAEKAVHFQEQYYDSVVEMG